MEESNVNSLIKKEDKYSAHIYSPLPVMLSKGKGCKVWDINGKEYYDFLSGYGSVNQGHCHPKIVKALTNQAEQLTLTSRAFYNNKTAESTEFICKTFGYDKVILMNTGAEANETALKLARKWGYLKKKIPTNKATIIALENNFHGRTIGIISASTCSTSKKDYGPLLDGFKVLPYDNIKALEESLKDPTVCALWIEPIQGEAGIIVPKDGYLQKAYELCKKYNVLFMADEIQTGLGRTGKILCCDYENVKPDILILGKSLSGGVYPISAVLSNEEIMKTMKVGEHGSTYGSNPLACAIIKESLQVILDEELSKKSFDLGIIFRRCLQDTKIKCSIVSEIRGKRTIQCYCF